MKRLVLFLLALGLLTGCNQNTTGTRLENTEGTKAVEGEPLKIGVLSIADSGALFVAKEEGIFSEYGCNVEVIEFSSAQDQSKAIEAGEIDGMMTDLIVPTLINKGGKNLKVVSIALGDKVENGKFVVLASPNGEYKDKTSIEGASIGISEDSMMEFLVDSYCEELGVNINSIEKVNIPSLVLRMETLLEGGIDCAILPEPLGDFAILKGAKVIIDDTKLNTNFSQSVIVVDNSCIEEDYENVANFVKAYNKSAETINANPEKYRPLILELANVPEDLKDSYILPIYSVNSITDKELFTRTQNWIVNKGLLDKAYTYEDMVEVSFVENTGE